VFITHFLDQVFAVSDRMTVLRNGRLADTFMTGGIDLSVGAVASLTGMTLRRTDTRASVRLSRTAAAAEFGLGNKTSFGADVQATPRWVVDAGADAVLGTYTSGGGAGFAVRDNGGYKVVFFGGMRMDADVLRAIYRYAGAHVFLDSDDVVQANDDLLVVHASRAGTKTLRFPRKVDVYDYFLGQWHLGVTQVQVGMSEAETRYFFYGTRSAIEARGLPAWPK